MFAGSAKVNGWKLALLAYKEEKRRISGIARQIGVMKREMDKINRLVKRQRIMDFLLGMFVSSIISLIITYWNSMLAHLALII